MTWDIAEAPLCDTSPLCARGSTHREPSLAAQAAADAHGQWGLERQRKVAEAAAIRADGQTRPASLLVTHCASSPSPDLQ